MDRGGLYARFFRAAEKKKFLDDEQTQVIWPALNHAREAVETIDINDFEKNDTQIFDQNMEKILTEFKGVLDIFDTSREADNFFNNFSSARELAERIVKDLRTIAKEVQSDKFNRDVSRAALNGIAAAAAALAILCPPAAVAGAAVCGVANVACAGVTVRENFSVNGKKEDALLSCYYGLEARKKRDSELAKQINEAADKIEGIFNRLNTVYEETKQYKSHEEIAEWKSFIVDHVPDNATSADIKKAFQHYLIRTYKLPTDGNKWMVMVPASHSKNLENQKQIEINKKSCKIFF